ncbi:MAG: hypothetical protein LBB73_01410, partial [Dysgonamonadaceae bacterium]|nr:hypothetical protein [Dysgonamonadaceae bacterium]
MYKNKDDSWRPLYVKVQKVDEDAEKEKKYEYVGKKWLEENKLFDVRVTPEVLITDLLNKFISDGKGKISLTETKGASFRISHADTIRKDGHTAGGKWFANETYSYTNPEARKFQNEDSVELFNISDGQGRLLTVSDDIDFDFPQRNSLAWADSLKDNGESVRQKFAIVRDYTDGSFTFLPVAARYWDKSNIEKTNDSLSFNLAIGRNNEGGVFVNLKGAWHLESTLSYKLVAADSLSKSEPLRFKLTSPLHRWNGPASDYVAVKKKS